MPRHPSFGVLPALLLALTFAGPAPADTSETGAWSADRGLLVRGTVVTMDADRRVIPNGAVLCRNGRIEAVLRAGDPLPAGAEEAEVVDTDGGLILPGLIDCHNHLEYDFRPLWDVPELYSNMYEWMGSEEYERAIKYPKRLLSSVLDIQGDVGRYAEVKALVAGTTAIQGSPPNRSYIHHLARNVEHWSFGSDRVRQRSIGILDTRWQAGLEDGLRAQMDEGAIDAWLVHLAEGTDHESREEFRLLRRLGLLQEETAIIHGIALEDEDFEAMAEAGAKLVASPLDNLLLYGRSADVPAAVDAGVTVSLGADWSPFGSKNLLTELKVVSHLNGSEWDWALTAREIVEMVTVNPARTIGWEDRVGRVAPGMHADLVVLDRIAAHPYRSVLETTELEVQLVLVEGEPVYGDEHHMEPLKGDDLEVILRRSGRVKTIDVTPDPEEAADRRIPAPDERFGTLRDRLDSALEADPDWIRANWPEDETPPPAGTMDDWMEDRFPLGIEPVDLDPVYTFEDGDYFETLETNRNAGLAGVDLERFWRRADARARRDLEARHGEADEGFVDRLEDDGRETRR